MEKPVSIIIEEFKQEVAEAVNKTKLPLCIIEPVVKDLYTEIAALSKQQLEVDKKKYEEEQEVEK